VLIAVLVAAALTAAPLASAQSPAVDQYQPQSPGGGFQPPSSPGGGGTDQGGGGAFGGDQGSAGVSGGENLGAGQPPGAVATEVQSGGGSLPFTGGYPATSLVLIVLALIAAGIGVRAVAAGYQRLRGTGSTAS
jgi:hypothetical protein